MYMLYVAMACWMGLVILATVPTLLFPNPCILGVYLVVADRCVTRNPQFKLRELAQKRALSDVRRVLANT